MFCIVLWQGDYTNLGAADLFWKKTKRFKQNKSKWTWHRFIMFRPVFGCTQHPKAGRNTQHTRAIINILPR